MMLATNKLRRNIEMGAFERSQSFDFAADQCYQAVSTIFRQLKINIQSQDAALRKIRGYWDSGIGARFTIEAACVPAGENTTRVVITFDPKWSPFRLRPMTIGKPPEVEGKINTIYTALARVLGSPGKPIDVRAIEDEPYSGDTSVIAGDNWVERLRKRLYGRNPFVSGFAIGCLMSWLSGLFSSGLVVLLALCLFLGQMTGRGGRTGSQLSTYVQLLGCIQLLIWVPILFALVRVSMKSLRDARLRQPSGEGLACGIGLYLLVNVLAAVWLFSSIGR
jgi:hypothetical protein